MDKKLLIAGFGIIAINIFALFFPESLWGIHYISFIPYTWQIILLLVCISLVWLASNTESHGLFDQLSLLYNKYSSVFYLAICTLMGLLFFHLPIINDIYGDAIVLKQSINATFTEMPEKYKSGLFSLDLSPSAGRRTMLGLYTYLAVWTGASYYEIFVVTDIIFGIGFFALWFQFIRTQLKSALWQISLTIVMISAPFTLIFYGHTEFYALAYLLQLSWYIVVIRYLQNRHSSLLIWSVLLLFLNIKVHPTGLLLIPSFLLMLAIHGRDRFKIIEQILNWRGVIKYIMIPLTIAGAVLYFFVFGSYNDPRNLENSFDLDHVFLPIVSPEPPYDRYNLLSFNHIFDYLNAILMWSPAALLIIGMIVANFRKKINWNTESVIIVGLTFSLYAFFLFMINPLLSMPMDWDLFCIPAIPYLVLLVLLIRRIDDQIIFSKKIVIATLGLSLLSIPVFIVNNSATALSERLESVGMHIFKTYYEWSETTLLSAVGMLHQDSVTSEYIDRKLKITSALRPYAIPANDTIYSMLLIDNGMYYDQIEKDRIKALAQYQEASIYDPDNAYTILKTLEVNFKLKQFEEAYLNARTLVGFRFPDRKKSLRMAIHCALEANKPGPALEHCKEYLKYFSKDRNILSVHNDLMDSIPIHVVLKHFR